MDTSDLIATIDNLYSLHTYTPKYDKERLDYIAKMIINNGLYDPIHDRINFPLTNIGLNDEERGAAIRILTYIATSPALRRLMFINQLSLSFIKFPLVTHTRYAHSLGVAFLMYKFLQHLYNAKLEIKKSIKIEPHHVVLGIIAGLIHDIGHPAWGHAFEPLGFKALPQYRNFNRYDKALLVYSIDKKEFLYDIFKVITEEGRDDYDNVFGNLGKDINVAIKAIFDHGFRTDHRISTIAESIIASLLDGPCDLDRLDYVYRDLLLAGIEEVKVGRIVEVLENSIDITKKDEEYRICFRKEHGEAIDELEQLLIKRKRLYKEVYEHSLRVAAGEMMQHALVGLLKKHNISRDVLRKLLFLTDRDVLSLIAVYGPDYSKYLIKSIMINELFNEINYEIVLSDEKREPKEIKMAVEIYNRIIKDRLSYLDSKIDLELAVHLEIRDKLAEHYKDIESHLERMGITHKNFDEFVNVGTDELPLVFIYLSEAIDTNKYLKTLCDGGDYKNTKNKSNPQIKVYVPNWINPKKVSETIRAILTKMLLVKIVPSKQNDP